MRTNRERNQLFLPFNFIVNLNGSKTSIERFDFLLRHL